MHLASRVIALVMILLSVFVVGGVTPRFAAAGDTVSPLESDFDIGVFVDHLNQTLTVSVFDGPPGGLAVLEVQSFYPTPMPGGVVAQTYFGVVMCDATGFGSLSTNFSSAPLLAEHETYVRGLFQPSVSAPTNLVFSDSTWVIDSTYIESFPLLANLDPDAHATITSIVANEVIPNEPGPNTLPTGASHAWTSNAFFTTGINDLSGSGYAHMAAPLEIFAVSPRSNLTPGGPEGVFTGN